MPETERQQAVNTLYRAYRDAGDDAMNARLRLLSEDAVTETEAAVAQAVFGDFDDDDSDLLFS